MPSRWWTPYLDPLLAVAAATLDETGVLVEANAGFLRLISVDVANSAGAHVDQFLRQPDFATLIHEQARADGEIYCGLLTVGEYMGRAQTLRARVWRVDGQLRMLAEYDIEDLERLNTTVLELNRDYANAQIELARTNLKLRQREAQIVAASLTDPLTGVGNRRQLDQALALEISRADRTGDPLCAFMADLDHFKNVNDVHGHEAGDKVLAAFGELLRSQTRAVDVVARFGGEEFVVLMPQIDLEHAIACADRIRVALASSRVEPLPCAVTGSFGVARLGKGEEADAFLRRIDKALYEAKESGRNRVVASNEEVRTQPATFAATPRSAEVQSDPAA